MFTCTDVNFARVCDDFSMMLFYKIGRELLRGRLITELDVLLPSVFLCSFRSRPCLNVLFIDNTLLYTIAGSSSLETSISISTSVPTFSPGT